MSSPRRRLFQPVPAVWRWQVVGRQLEFYRVLDLEMQLTTSKWGIREPDPQQVAHSVIVHAWRADCLSESPASQSGPRPFCSASRSTSNMSRLATSSFRVQTTLPHAPPVGPALSSPAAPQCPGTGSFLQAWGLTSTATASAMGVVFKALVHTSPSAHVAPDANPRTAVFDICL